jgi:hypothetical protein
VTTAGTISPLAKNSASSPDHRVVLAGAPDGVIELLDPLPPGATVSVQAGGVSEGRQEGRTDLNRDILWARLGEHGLAGVTLVAVNDVWSAMRFRSVDQVGR